MRKKGYDMVSVELFNKNYLIPEKIWDKHIEMHPVRPIDALAHNLKIVYGERNYSSEEIESVIMDEYDVHSNMGEILDSAEEIYDGTHSC